MEFVFKLISVALNVCIRLILEFVNEWVALKFSFTYKFCYLLSHVFHIVVRD